MMADQLNALSYGYESRNAFHDKTFFRSIVSSI